MLNKLEIKNLTVFPDAVIQLGRLNVIVGENGAGKTHLLKALYSAVSVSAEASRRNGESPPTKSYLQTRIAEKLVGVFQPDALGRLASRKQGRERCEIKVSFDDDSYNIAFSFSTNSKSEVTIDTLPSKWVKSIPAYLPTRELLTIYPNFVSTYDSHYLEFEETWRDTCLLLGVPSLRGPRNAKSQGFLRPIEQAIDGSIVLDSRGRFYLRPNGSQTLLEVSLVAEGHRKLGMLSHLIANGVLLDRGCLFWDEPEANLNPKTIKTVAKVIVELSRSGIQTVIATHSLFLLRELDILQSTDKSVDAQFVGLHKDGDIVIVNQSRSIDSIGDIAALDEELEQSDRYLHIGY